MTLCMSSEILTQSRRVAKLVDQIILILRPSKYKTKHPLFGLASWSRSRGSVMISTARPCRWPRCSVVNFAPLRLCVRKILPLLDQPLELFPVADVDESWILRDLCSGLFRVELNGANQITHHARVVFFV